MVSPRAATGAQAGVLVAAATAGALIATTGGTSAATHVRYRTTPVTRTTVTDRISATGTVTPNATIDLGFGASDVAVTSVRVKVGQHVQTGQLLATVDDGTAHAQFVAAQTALTAAQSMAAATAASTATTPVPVTRSTLTRTPATAQTCRTPARPTPTASRPPNRTSPRPTPTASKPPTTTTASPSRSPAGWQSPTATATTPGPSTSASSPRSPSPAATSSAPRPRRSTAPAHPPTRPTTTSCRTAGRAGGPTGPARQASAAATPGSGSRAAGTGTSAGNTGNSVTAAQQQVSAARVEVAATRIVAPQPGVVTAVNLIVGTLPGTPAVEMRSTALAVQVPVQEQDAPYVHADQAAQVTYTALDVTGTGTVSGAPLEPSSTASTGTSGLGGSLAGLLGLTGATPAVVTYPVAVSISNPPPGLLAGMSAQVTWTAATRSNVLAVPTGAIHSSGVTDDVQILVNGTPQTRIVTLGLSTSSMTEVTSGLQQGDRVITGLAA